jgi:hypothetical protein
MTNNELLDKILYSYLYGLKLKLEKDPRYKRLSFKLVAKAQEKGIDDWHIDFLKKQLFADGFLKQSGFGDGEPYELTDAGIKAAQVGWYKENATEKQTEKEIRKQTLANLKRSKLSLTISIFAIIVPTIISLYSLWTSKQSPTIEEQKELKQRIENLENSRNEHNVILVDSLKKNK